MAESILLSACGSEPGNRKPEEKTAIQTEVGCVDKDTKESEEKYVEEEYKEEGFKGVEEELSEYRNKFIEMYTQNICDGRIFPVGKRIRQNTTLAANCIFTKQMGKFLYKRQLWL